jgi:hypothetical protein
MHQSILSRQDGDEGTEVHQFGNLAFLGGTNLLISGDIVPVKE